MAGLVAVEGSGVVVTLRDSPRLSPGEKRPEIVTNYQVHDADIRAIVGELIPAGAEAGERRRGERGDLLTDLRGSGAYSTLTPAFRATNLASLPRGPRPISSPESSLTT